MYRYRIPLVILISGIALLTCLIFIYQCFCRPTEILIVNALPTHVADIMMNNDNSRINVTCVDMENAGNFADYDAILLYGRGLYLDSIQAAALKEAADKGIPVYTNSLRNSNFNINCNIDSLQSSMLGAYLEYPCQSNYRNLLRFIRNFATPSLWGDKSFDLPIEIPENIYYHLEGGKYFSKAEELTAYLKDKNLYNYGGEKVVLVSGVTFPVEGNRAHIDTLINRLFAAGYNVYPTAASGLDRNRMLSEVSPSAIVYLPMGRLGNDSLINNLYDRHIPIFMPFPLIQSREDWLDINKPLSGGTLNARIVIPEIDGAMTPLCISTVNRDRSGLLLNTPEPERIDAFMQQFTGFMNLRLKPNKDKKIAIGYFRSPGKDALVASGMEVVPSLYNFLKRLQSEGYNVGELPATISDFRHQLNTFGFITGSYAHGAQGRFMDEANPIWVDKTTYTEWITETLNPDKYGEVTTRYGEAPGQLSSRNDSLAIVALRYGNVLLFPQPRPAVGEDEFKLIHGAEVAPPHNYIATYLYLSKEFNADALIHFGTHGNLEFTPGKNVGLSKNDWADVLIGNLPHFYFYTTGNVGEAIIAKRRSHAVIVTHLTPPFVENGIQKRYRDLEESIHEAIATPAKNSIALKKWIVSAGIHRDLDLDSTFVKPYTSDELKHIDSFIEEIANEKITGAYYTLGSPYSIQDLNNTVVAIMADKLAYERAKSDHKSNKITTEDLHNYDFVSKKYLRKAKFDINTLLNSSISDTSAISPDLRPSLRYRDLIITSTDNELNAMVNALNGIPVRPTPGGDLVVNPNVLPTGRNMYSINAETTPDNKAWTNGVMLAEKTIESYVKEHGDYPRKICYTFWAGEFITSQGATIAQALRMLGVEPIRDEQGRVIDLKLTPSEELGRPRINILVQVSGQLRDIAGSRLRMLTDAIKLASEADDEQYPNYVAQGSKNQEKELITNGISPTRARELSTMRIFGPVNSGYSTGMLRYTESSGEWDNPMELADGYINNMCAMYGDDDNWEHMDPTLFKSAISNTDVVVQPRQSNTWGPISLDHVYEFTGAFSLAAKQINGKEPDAMMADYRNSYIPRMQDTKTAIAVECRATILNPEFIKERMAGEATTAQMFGEIFRNIFGWSATRPSALNENIYNDLYDVYIADINNLGIREFFNRVNPAAFQEMTATMLESARKGYWEPTSDQLKNTALVHAEITDLHGAPCTEFICGNKKLQQFIASSLDGTQSERYQNTLSEVLGGTDDGKILKEETIGNITYNKQHQDNRLAVAVIIVILLVFIIMSIRNYKKRS